MVKQKRLTYLDLACQTSRKRLCSKMRRFGDLAANNCPQIMVFDWADSYIGILDGCGRLYDK